LDDRQTCAGKPEEERICYDSAWQTRTAPSSTEDYSAYIVYMHTRAY